MSDENYNFLLDRLAKSCGLDKEEIERRVNAKREKLSGLISKEGAIHVISSELGISLDEGKCKIEELTPGMRKVNLVGKIIKLFPVRSYTQKDGTPSKVANMILADNTSNVKVVLWDTNHIKLLEDGIIKEGDIVEVVNSSIREGEVHLGSFSDFKKSNEKFDSIQTEKVVKEKSIADFHVGDSVNFRGFIVQSFEPRFFNVNKQTGRKISQEEIDSGIASEKRALINLVVDDGTETVRAVLFFERMIEIGLSEINDVEKLKNQRDDLLGKEFIFSGTIKMNSYFNTPELIVEKIERVNLDELIKKLE